LKLAKVITKSAITLGAARLGAMTRSGGLKAADA
jgi:hypothetical protein